MIDTSNCEEHYEEVLRVAKTMGRAEELTSTLAEIDKTLASTSDMPISLKLFKDVRPLSFVIHVYKGSQFSTLVALVWEEDADGHRWQPHFVGQT
jgi:hypothetical protein